LTSACAAAVDGARREGERRERHERRRRDPPGLSKADVFITVSFVGCSLFDGQRRHALDPVRRATAFSAATLTPRTSIVSSCVPETRPCCWNASTWKRSGVQRSVTSTLT
jgi:hypothetical protein